MRFGSWPAEKRGNYGSQHVARPSSPLQGAMVPLPGAMGVGGQLATGNRGWGFA
jgi:hypothetical protein